MYDFNQLPLSRNAAWMPHSDDPTRVRTPRQVHLDFLRAEIKAGDYLNAERLDSALVRMLAAVDEVVQD